MSDEIGSRKSLSVDIVSSSFFKRVLAAVFAALICFSSMPAMAAGEKPIIFGDLSYYWIADRTGRTFKRLNELYAATGQVGFIGNQRVDGKLILPEAIKVLKLKGTAASGS